MPPLPRSRRLWRASGTLAPPHWPLWNLEASGRRLEAARGSAGGPRGNCELPRAHVRAAAVATVYSSGRRVLQPPEGVDPRRPAARSEAAPSVQAGIRADGAGVGRVKAVGAVADGLPLPRSFRLCVRWNAGSESVVLGPRPSGRRGRGGRFAQLAGWRERSRSSSWARGAGLVHRARRCA